LFLNKNKHDIYIIYTLYFIYILKITKKQEAIKEK